MATKGHSLIVIALVFNCWCNSGRPIDHMVRLPTPDLRLIPSLIFELIGECFELKFEKEIATSTTATYLSSCHRAPTSTI